MEAAVTAYLKSEQLLLFGFASSKSYDRVKLYLLGQLVASHTLIILVCNSHHVAM